MDSAAVAWVFAGLAAALHVYIFVMETLRWEDPATRKVFGTTAEQAAASKQLAANQGVYNLMLAVAAVVGIILVATGERTVGMAIVLTATGMMAGAATYLVATDGSKLRAAAVQGTFPLIALVAGVVALI